MTPLTDKSRTLFAADRYATEATGAEVEEVREDYARCTLRVEDRHRNAMGAVMGGAMFTLADLAFAAAANSRCIADGEPLCWVSVGSSIQFLSPARGSRLTAEACCVKRGRSLCTFTIAVRDELNTQTALVTTTGMRTN